MRNHLIISVVTLFLSCSYAFAADTVLSESDMPAMREALKNSYTLELCRKDIPVASVKTCKCLGEEMAANLDTSKLLLCQKEGYEDCVAAEFTAAKSALSDKQINGCKALTPGLAVPPAPAEKKAE